MIPQQRKRTKNFKKNTFTATKTTMDKGTSPLAPSPSSIFDIEEGEQQQISFSSANRRQYQTLPGFSSSRNNILSILLCHRIYYYVTVVGGALLLITYLVSPSKNWVSSSSSPPDKQQRPEQFTLSSSAFGDGMTIPSRYTRLGDNVSPPLSWIGAPATTKSFVLVMDDPDAPSAQPWVHWIIFKIPKDTNALPEGINVVEYPPMQHGQNSWKLVQYDGPQPPLGQTHLYVFTLYALDTMDITNLEGGEENGATYHRTPVPTKDILLMAISGHILDQAQWTGRFQQSSR